MPTKKDDKKRSWTPTADKSFKDGNPSGGGKPSAGKTFKGGGKPATRNRSALSGLAETLSTPGFKAQEAVGMRGGPPAGKSFSGAAKRRLESQDTGWSPKATMGPSPFGNDIEAAMAYLDNRQALAGLDEGARFGRSPSAEMPAPGGGIMGGDTARDMAVMENGQSDLPEFFRDTPLGRKVERDGWELTPEDERALQTIIADRLRNGNL